MFAVIKTGGKQYRVCPGDKIKVEKLGVRAGGKVVFDEVLMVGGGDVAVGCPTVEGAAVKATAIKHGLGNKIIVYKFKRRKGYHKKQGHRQDYTLVEILDVLTDANEVKKAIEERDADAASAPAEEAVADSQAEDSASGSEEE